VFALRHPRTATASAVAVPPSPIVPPHAGRSTCLRGSRERVAGARIAVRSPLKNVLDESAQAARRVRTRGPARDERKREGGRMCVCVCARARACVCARACELRGRGEREGEGGGEREGEASWQVLCPSALSRGAVPPRSLHRLRFLPRVRRIPRVVAGFRSANAQ